MRPAPRRAALPALGVGIFALALYLSTAAPGITWRNGGIDSGELATAVATGSVAHPPGYPTYLALGRLAALLPVEPARALAWFSAVCAALACAGVAWAAAAVPKPGERGQQLFVTLAPGLWLATAPLLWASATYAEVNAPMAAVTALWLAFRGWEVRPTRQLLGVGLFLGLALGIHALLVVLAAGTALGQLVAPGRRQRLIALSALTAGGVAGAGVAFGSLALLPPAGPVNWYAPQTPEGWRLLVTADAYRGLFAPAGAPLGLLAMLRALVENFAFVGAIAVVAGLQEVLARPGQRLSDGTLLCAGLALVYVLFAAAYAARDAEAYLLPTLVLLSPAALAGLRAGAAALGQGAGRAAMTRAAIAAIAIVPSLANGVIHYGRLNLSADRDASEYATGLLAGAPPNAVLMTTGDAATFALWYARYARGVRPDVAVLNDDLLPRGWYRQHVERLHPDLSNRQTISVPPISAEVYDR